MIKLSNFKPALIGSVLFFSSSLGMAQESLNSGFNNIESDIRQQKTETKGILGGVVVGAVLAGPPGAIVAAAIGGLLGNSHHTKKENTLLQASLTDSNAQLLALQTQQNDLQEQLEIALQVNQSSAFVATALTTENDSSACCHDSSLAIHFKTNSNEVEKHYLDKLQSISNLANSNQNAIVEITGYADSRGNQDENYLLSLDRVLSVQDLLISMNVKSSDIQSNAYGETQPINQEQTLEDHFFNRRVNIRVRSSNNDFLTQND